VRLIYFTSFCVACNFSCSESIVEEEELALLEVDSIKMKNIIIYKNVNK
jgi:hypothetical protein